MSVDDPTTEHIESKAAAPTPQQLAAVDTDADGDAEFDEVMALLDGHSPDTPAAQIEADDESLLERVHDAVILAQVEADVDRDGRLTVGDLLTWLRSR